MAIQALSITYKTAPAEIRGAFAFDEEKRNEILNKLVSTGQVKIEEAVLVVTCNRIELYVFSRAHENTVFQRCIEVLLEESQTVSVPGIRDMIRRFSGKSAVHHLMKVMAGLDSLVIGEDQILGQMKDAYFEADKAGFCGPVFHLLFRYAITASKRVKTDTKLSKSSVSTASLALKQVALSLGDLSNKTLLIIGATGKIGGIVLRDALCMEGLRIFVTIREELPRELNPLKDRFTVIPYKDRYKYINEADAVISATSSPVFTITKERLMPEITISKKRVFVDLAVPYDIDKTIGQIHECQCFAMEDMEELIRMNTLQKQDSIIQGKEILAQYEEEFYKSYMYKQHFSDIQKAKERFVSVASEKGLEKAFDQLLIHFREEGNSEYFEVCMELVKKYSKQ